MTNNGNKLSAKCMPVKSQPLGLPFYGVGTGDKLRPVGPLGSYTDLTLSFSLSIGVVLRVEVRVTFPASALSRNTPVMQAVLFEDPNDARFLNVWPVSQVRNIFVV